MSGAWCETCLEYGIKTEVDKTELIRESKDVWRAFCPSHLKGHIQGKKLEEFFKDKDVVGMLRRGGVAK